MIEEEIVLNEGFLVQPLLTTSRFQQLNSSEKKLSQYFSLPKRVAKAINLFNEMGILRTDRAYLTVPVSEIPAEQIAVTYSTSLKKAKYSVFLNEDTLLFRMSVYARQAIILEQKHKSSTVKEFADSLLSQAKTAFAGKENLTKSRLGLFSILQILFDETKMSNDEKIELITNDIPLTRVVPLWNAGADIKDIIDLADIPDSWVEHVLK